MPKISVLMPVYKTNETYLRQAIESILNQTFEDFEFLILDDCPEDSREHIVKSYDDKRIKYFQNERNWGISLSRNKLIDLSKGEYLAVFDHDDISRPDRLEKEAAYLDANPEVGAVSAQVHTFPRDKISNNPLDDHDIKVALTGKYVISHSASMLRKSVLDKNHIRYEEEYTPAEDYTLWCRLARVTNLHNLPDVLLEYRAHKSNTSNNQKKQMGSAALRARIRYQQEHPSLWAEYKLLAVKIYETYLLGFIPLVKIEISCLRAKIWFCGFLILKIKIRDAIGYHSV